MMVAMAVPAIGGHDSTDKREHELCGSKRSLTEYLLVEEEARCGLSAVVRDVEDENKNGEALHDRCGAGELVGTSGEFT